MALAYSNCAVLYNTEYRYNVTIMRLLYSSHVVVVAQPNERPIKQLPVPPEMGWCDQTDAECMIQTSNK